MGEKKKIMWKPLKNNQAESSLADVSMYPMEPVLYNLPFLSCLIEIYIHAIFSVDPFQSFHIEISKMIDKCLFDLLRRREIYTDCTGK